MHVTISHGYRRLMRDGTRTGVYSFTDVRDACCRHRYTCAGHIRRHSIDMDDLGASDTTFSDDFDQIARTNLQASRLLALPVELRLRILSFMVKDVHVHVFRGFQTTPYGRVRYTRMDVLPFDHPPPAYFDAFVADKWRNILQGDHRSKVQCPHCKRSSMSSIDGHSITSRHHHHPVSFPLLPLWRVCRQFHNEVLGLLFSPHNVFSFSGYPDPILPNFLLQLPHGWEVGVSKMWVTNVNEIKSHVEYFGIRGLRDPLEIHAARNSAPPREGAETIYGVSPLWLTDPYGIESDMLEKKRQHWAAKGTKLVFHERLLDRPASP